MHIAHKSTSGTQQNTFIIVNFRHTQKIFISLYGFGNRREGFVSNVALYKGHVGNVKEAMISQVLMPNYAILRSSSWIGQPHICC